ncbi:MAG: 2-dehydropantoate 2-reductase [Proteobacteria bacterium]|nr:2-dehydropantoate 2-reductase [Pseudomonadota bacterium]
MLVIGAGAIGAFYGGVLARAGCEVSAVARSDFDAVKANGYRIESTLGDLSWRPAQLVHSGADYEGPADYLLVCLKLTASTDPVALIRPALGPKTVIVFVANGIDVDGPVAAAFPHNELIAGVAYAAVSREASGVIRHHSQFTRLILGRYPGGPSATAERLAALVKQGGSSGAATDDIVGTRWQKCAWNTVLNPISALGGGLGTLDMLRSEHTTQFVRDAIGEFSAIAAAAGHPLPGDTIDKLIAGTLKLPNYVSSMGQDQLAGRPMETEALLGNVVRVARRLAVPAPRLETLYALLKMTEQRSAG